MSLMIVCDVMESTTTQFLNPHRGWRVTLEMYVDRDGGVAVVPLWSFCLSSILL
nr:hypothetical protein [uncultured Undibacterium sp.]